MMKLNFLLASALLLAACSKDTVDNNVQQQAQELVFTMSEAPYNADVDMATRTAVSKVIKDTLDFGTVEAEVTLQRDTTQVKQVTRAVTSGNHYTIVAFKVGTAQEVAQMKGYFDTGTGKFKYETGSDMIRIPAGNYDFVCYTHQYATRVGNTVNIPAANADKAFVCRSTNVAIANQKRQELAFTMKHVGARVRLKISAMMEPTGLAGSLGYLANQSPASTNYDMITGTFTASTAKNSSAKMQAQAYDEAEEVEVEPWDYDEFTAKGNQYLTIPAGTKPEELVYQITSGNVYKVNINTGGARKLKATGAFEANGSYTLVIKLLPKYKYLFEDGQTGYLKDANRQGHTPIAVVYAPHKAVSLWIANNNMTAYWDNDYRLRNSHIFTNKQDALTNTTSGKVWTWETNFGGKAKATLPQFGAYYSAANFYNSTKFKNQLKAGQTLASNLNKPGVWYLPSLYEWKEALIKIGLMDGSVPMVTETYYPWQGKVAVYAFEVAGGEALAAIWGTNIQYWSSSEYNHMSALSVDMHSGGIAFHESDKLVPLAVRAFVEF